MEDYKPEFRFVSLGYIVGEGGVVFTSGKKSSGTAEGQGESSFARTAYLRSDKLC